jgi:outer membrane protein TolC
MKYSISILLALVLSSAVFGQPRKISLQETIELAVKNSGQLKGAAAKIEEATAALKEAVERRLPDVTASASYLRLGHPNVDLKTKSNTGSGTQQSSPNISQVAYGMLNASLPIYSGGRIRYGIEAAQYLEKAAKFDAESQRPEVEMNAINAYINLLKAGSVVALVKENLESAQQRLKDLSNLEQNGLLARNDLMKAQLQQSNIELSLLDAENNLQLATVSTNLLLGLPENTNLEIDSASIAPATTELKTLDSYEQTALQNRKEIEALNYQTKAATVNVKSAASEKLPGVALTGGYVAADIPGFVTITNAVNIGVGVQYSLSSLWKNKSKVEQARSRQKQLEINQSILTDNIRLQVNKAYQDYMLTRKKTEVYQKAIDQATENFRIVKNKFENSLATTTDVLDADVALLQARINYSNAKADVALAYNELLQSAGLLSHTK